MTLFDGPHTFVRVALYAFFLGTVFSGGLMWAVFGLRFGEVGLYLMGMAIFHQSEYMQTALWKPKHLSLDCAPLSCAFRPCTDGITAFLLNHSEAYHAAFVASLIEFAIESWFWPALKDYLWPIKIVGFFVMMTGIVVRILAMSTARESFNHIVQHQRADDHSLITTGIYGYASLHS